MDSLFWFNDSVGQVFIPARFNWDRARYRNLAYDVRFVFNPPNVSLMSSLKNIIVAE